jgi:hypothetical protein
MNSTPVPSATPGPGLRTQLDQRVTNTRREFESIEAGGRAWIDSSPAELCRTFATNRQWFRTDTVFESSVFLYLDLSADHEAVQRAERIHRTAQETLGDANVNLAPSRRLHSTILTDVVAQYERLADAEVSRVADLYAHLYQAMPPCLVSVLGPRLTPGGIILECRIHEPALFAMREAARLLGERNGRRPRIPTNEYATLGYLTGGDYAALVELYEVLRRMRVNCAPIEVAVDRVLVTLTVNKAIVPPTLEFALTAAPDGGGPEAGD